jgi:hypothetical protein
VSIPNYVKMSSGELLHELGADGRKWAEAFQQRFPNTGVDSDTLLVWFCNAVMAGYDYAHGNPPLNGDHAEWLMEHGGSAHPTHGSRPNEGRHE